MSDFEWPWEYNFPPFFTLQPHAKTREQQLSVWCNLLLKYQKFKNQTQLNLNDNDTPLFINKTINRRLSSDFRLLILEELLKTGHSLPLDKKRTQWEIYWYTIDELSTLIYDWINETGQLNTVLTIYEISNGDNSIGKEFYELNLDVILKALKLLEDKGKCELILFDDSQGVKFF